MEEIRNTIAAAVKPEVFVKKYANILLGDERVGEASIPRR
jgi:hypothetical protein